MEGIELNAETRVANGSNAARRLRADGKVPANLYGHGMAPLSLTVGAREFLRVMHVSGENALLKLKITGEEAQNVDAIVKEIQLHPVTDACYHIDFNAISLKEKIEVHVPVHETGDCPGVRDGGLLEHTHRELEIECLPTDIPERIDVPIDQLQIGDVVHVRDIVFPEGIKCLNDPDDVVLSVHTQQAEEEDEGEEDVVSAEPEVIGKAKEGEAAEGAGGKSE